MKVYELINELSKCPAGAEVKFHATVTDAEVKCNGPVDIEENTPLFALSFTIGDVEADGLRGSVYLYEE